MATRRNPVTDPDAASNGGINPSGQSVGSQIGQPGGWSGGYDPGKPEVSPNQPHDPTITPTNPIPGQNLPNITSDYGNGPTPSHGAADLGRARADALLSKYGYKDNGRGSGFGDESYWLDQINGLSGTAADDMWKRWEADLSGKGSDNPGPGDKGNASHDPNAGGGGQGGLVLPSVGGPSFSGTSLPSSVSPNMASDSSFLDTILGQLQGITGKNVPSPFGGK